MANNPKKSSYKKLRSKLFDNRRKEHSFDEAVYNMIGALLPKGQQPTKGKKQSDQGSDGRVENLQQTFEKRMALMDKNNAANIRALQKENAKYRAESNEELKKSFEISDRLREAISNIYKQKQQGTQQPQQTTGSGTQTAQEPQRDLSAVVGNINSLIENKTAAPAKESGEAEKTNQEGIVTNVTPEKENAARKVVGSLNINDKISVGDYVYKVTNKFGMREGANAVGDRDPEHSRGIDVVTYDKAGNKTNAPVAIGDGVITGVHLQGSGGNVGTNKKEAGYYMTVLMDDGKLATYMHLSPDVYKNNRKLIGTRVARGQQLFEGDHSKWSGSGSQNHTKISISDADETGKNLKNYSDPENDPSYYFKKVDGGWI